MSNKKSSFRTNKPANIPPSPEIEFLQPEKKAEQSALIRRMVEIVLGTKTVTMQTRSERLLYFLVLVTTATGWWYWLKQVERYRIETMTEQGMFEYDQKGKLVVTEEYQKAANDPYLVSTVGSLRLRKKVERLEEELLEFKVERGRILEVLENQKRIESKLQSLEDKLS